MGDPEPVLAITAANAVRDGYAAAECTDILVQGGLFEVVGTLFGATQADSTLEVGGIAVAHILSWSATRILALCPPDATDGEVTITVGVDDATYATTIETAPGELRALYGAVGIVRAMLGDLKAVYDEDIRHISDVMYPCVCGVMVNQRPRPAVGVKRWVLTVNWIVYTQKMTSRSRAMGEIVSTANLVAALWDVRAHRQRLGLWDAMEPVESGITYGEITDESVFQRAAVYPTEFLTPAVRTA